MVNRAGILLAVALVFIWGISYPLTRLAEYYASPIMITLVRAILGFVAVYPLTKAIIINRRFALTAMLNMGLFLVLLNVSIMYSSNPGLAALMVYTQPIFASIFEYLILKGRFTGIQWVALALGFTGVSVTMVNTPRLDPWALLGLAAGVLWGLGSVLYSMWFRGLDPRASLASSSLLTIPLAALLIPVDPSFNPTPIGLGLVLLVAMVAQVLGFLIWFRAMSLERPSTVSIILMLTPIVALYLSHIMLNSPLTPMQGFGSLVAVLGILMFQWARIKTGG
mgnify:FL=1